jgi:hypothetical protein
LIALAEQLDAAAIDWVVGGSTARALQGFAATPRDLDLEVAEDATHAAASAIGLAAHRDEDPNVTSTRAQGTWGGVEIDLIGGLTLHGPGGHLHADYPLLRLFSKAVPLRERTIWVAPVEEQIARSIVAGAGDRLDRIANERPAGYIVDDVYLSLRLASAAIDV